MMRVPSEKALRKIQVEIATRVAHHLSVKRKNAVLFKAVGNALGRPFVNTGNGGAAKAHGYALVMEYARQKGIWPVVSGFTPEDPPKSLKSKAPTWKAPRRAARFGKKDDFLQTYEWRRLRMEVIKERGTRCECCGHSPSDGVTVLNVDHIKPRKMHPELALDKSNLQILCDACNHGKGNWDQTDWRPTVPGSDTVQ